MKKRYIDQSVTSDIKNLSSLDDVLVSEKPKIKDFRAGKRGLYLGPKKGEAYSTCSAKSSEYVCCNVKVLKAVTNCPYDCSYCFLQDYLNDSMLSAVSNPESLIDELKAQIKQQPWRFFRVGTWELGDSLALEAQTGQAKQMIEAFSDLPSAVLELKTKSDQVDGILDVNHQGRTVVAWSLNPAEIINDYEHQTASLSDRFKAIRKVIDAGYLVAFHFDPMICYKGWEAGYTALISDLFSFVPLDRVAWVSIGSLRYNQSQKSKMDYHFPGSDLSAGEMILGPDQKVRYVKPLRLEMYQVLVDRLKKAFKLKDLSLGLSDANIPIVYLCMERFDVWERCLGFSPEDVGHCDYLFTSRLMDRYPYLVHQKPDLDLYHTFQHL